MSKLTMGCRNMTDEDWLKFAADAQALCRHRTGGEMKKAMLTCSYCDREVGESGLCPACQTQHYMTLTAYCHECQQKDTRLRELEAKNERLRALVRDAVGDMTERARRCSRPREWLARAVAELEGQV